MCVMYCNESLIYLSISSIHRAHRAKNCSRNGFAWFGAASKQLSDHLLAPQNPRAVQYLAATCKPSDICPAEHDADTDIATTGYTDHTLLMTRK